MDNSIPATSAPVSTETEQVATEEVVADQGTETPPSTEPTTAPSQEVDPLAVLETIQLDPKVKEVLKSGFLRQKDYTQKTQEIAEVRKTAETYNQWKPVIDYLSRNPEVANTLFGTAKSKTAPEEQEIPDDPKEFMKMAKDQAKAEAIAEFRKEMAMNKDIDEAETLDPRLKTDETFAKQIAGFIEVNFGKQIRDGEITVTEATKQALETHRQYEESLRQKVITDLNDQAKKKTMVIPPGNGSPLATAPKKGTMDMREAAKLAEEEISRS